METTGSNRRLAGLAQAASGRAWAIAAGDASATQAALRVRSEGGSVVDAAIAASAVLSVTMPHATSIGGDALMLVRDAATGRVEGLNATGCAPLRIDRHVQAGPMPMHGAVAAVVPGLVSGWQAAHRRFGSFRWAGLFREAIALASRGCRVTASLAGTIRERQTQLLADPGCAGLFLPSGMPLREGALLKQPQLASTLGAISDLGPGALYGGGVGRDLAQAVSEAGGALCLDDLTNFRADWVAPVHLDCGGWRIHAMPPNSLGVLMLMQLQALDGLPSRHLADGRERCASWQIAIMRSVFAQALHRIGDPRLVADASTVLLSADFARSILERATQSPTQQRAFPASSGTACVVVCDEHGNAACVVQSIFNPFGSHFLDRSTGILLNNRISGFSSEPNTVNSLRPGHRCAHTLNPVIITENGDLKFVYASPGGISQTITGTQIIMNLMKRGLTLPAAVAEPRWAVDRRGAIIFESAWAPREIRYLQSAGIELRQERNEYFFGSVTAIETKRDGSLLAVADARRTAAALAC